MDRSGESGLDAGLCFPPSSQVSPSPISSSPIAAKNKNKNKNKTAGTVDLAVLAALAAYQRSMLASTEGG